MPETANGPEGVSEWDAINWALHEQNVARLRQRTFTAARDGDWPKVRNLQKMMLRSWSNTLVSVRQVTQRNAGRRTAGIDRVVALDGPARMAVAREAHRTIKSWEPVPVRRVYIPKVRIPTNPIARSGGFRTPAVGGRVAADAGGVILPLGHLLLGILVRSVPLRNRLV